ncbi:MAG: radical SAM family heme chaperone HemW [Puniceicoccaceae bacterium]
MPLQEKPPLGLGIYFHIPFCPTLCDFCAFYKNLPDRQALQRYLTAMTREVNLLPQSRAFDTVFWGGGTPSLLHPDQLVDLARALPHSDAICEWTVEAAPASINRRKLETLRQLGVTRLSIGVQSFQPELLDRLGRHHSRAQAIRAYETAREVGFDSVNLDLMFALPGQSPTDLLLDLQEAIALAPDHLSTYCLTFEEDTALFIRLSQGKVHRDIDNEVDLYRLGWETLEAAGYQQYEISNFSRPNHNCLHNLNTWMMGEWIGYGPSASSQLDNQRYTNTPDLHRWIDGISHGRPDRVDQMPLTKHLLAVDRLIFGLRLSRGVPLAGFSDTTFSPTEQIALSRLVDQLLGARFAEERSGNLTLTLEGRLRCDAIGSEILAATDTEYPAPHPEPQRDLLSLTA